MDRDLLMRLLAGDDEASALALAALRTGATFSVGDTAHPAGRHAGVFGHRLRRMRMHGVEPLGPERAVQLLSEHGRPVRVGLIDSADRTWYYVRHRIAKAWHSGVKEGVRPTPGALLPAPPRGGLASDPSVRPGHP